MKVLFNDNRICLDVEDEHDQKYLDAPLTLDILCSINSEMNTGVYCGRMTESEATNKILYLYKEHLRQTVWEMRLKC